MPILKTGNKYRIGESIYEVIIEPNPDLTCQDQCEINNCTANKDFTEFKKSCGCEICLQLVGIGQCFKLIK